jgi:hypothetical protein
VHQNVFIDVVVVLVESNHAPLTLAKVRTLSIHATPALETMSYQMDFILTYLVMLFQQIMLHLTASSQDGCDKNDCMVTHCMVTHCMVTQCMITHCMVTHCMVTHSLVTHCMVTHCMVTHCMVTHCMVTHCMVTHCKVTHCMVTHCMVTHSFRCALKAK